MNGAQTSYGIFTYYPNGGFNTPSQPSKLSFVNEPLVKNSGATTMNYCLVNNVCPTGQSCWQQSKSRIIYLILILKLFNSYLFIIACSTCCTSCTQVTDVSGNCPSGNNCNCGYVYYSNYAYNSQECPVTCCSNNPICHYSGSGNCGSEYGTGPGGYPYGNPDQPCGYPCVYHNECCCGGWLNCPYQPYDCSRIWETGMAMTSCGVQDFYPTTYLPYVCQYGS